MLIWWNSILLHCGQESQFSQSPFCANGPPTNFTGDKPLASRLPVGLPHDLPTLNPFASVDPMGLPQVYTHLPYRIRTSGLSFGLIAGLSGRISIKCRCNTLNYTVILWCLQLVATQYLLLFVVPTGRPYSLCLYYSTYITLHQITLFTVGTLWEVASLQFWEEKAWKNINAGSVQSSKFTPETGI